MKKFTLLIYTIFFLQISFAQHFQRIEVEAKLDHAVKMNGVAVADYDQDGDLDIYFTGIENFDINNDSTWSRLFQNQGDGTFEDVTIEAGFGIQYVNEGLKAERGEKMGAAWGDYDNDGFPDLFLANSREDQLYRNNGDGTFEDVTAQAGVAGCNLCYSASGTWFDHDRDGDLDLYVSLVNDANIFYENKGDGTFEDITVAKGVGGERMITWSTVALDVGKDGYLDIWNINDTQINEFFENRSGQHYNEASRAYRLDDEGAGMGIAIGDYNNDGFFDAYVTNIFSHHPNPLFENTGNRRFSDKAAEMGVEDAGWAWGTHFFDYDHDGDEDLAVVNGPIDKLTGNVQEDIDNFFFKNMLTEGTMTFEDESQSSGFDGKAKGKGLEVFDYDMDGDLDLLSNAFKFTENGGRIHIIVIKDELNHQVLVKVEDNGRGMKKEHADHAFERFYQGTEYITNGTGLGLSLSKMLLDLHHGNISVESEYGVGTRFEIQLKLGKEHFLTEQLQTKASFTLHEIEPSKEIETPAMTQTLKRQPDESTMPNVPTEHSILVIEDNGDLIEFLNRKLSPHYEILLSKNGEEGLEMAYDQIPDLIISDVMMPKKDGIALTKILKSDIRTAHIPIILLTAQSTREHQLAGLQTGADLYITKPFDLELLKEQIKTLLRSRAMLKEKYIGDIQPTNVPDKLNKKFINQFKTIVETNYSNPKFGVNDICAEIGLSRVQVYRKVKAMLDCSVSDYIQNLRLEKAKYLLREGKLSIAEIAYQVGYTSPSYLSTAFKGRFGETPSKWRG